MEREPGAGQQGPAATDNKRRELGQSPAGVVVPSSPELWALSARLQRGCLGALLPAASAER